MIITDLKKLRKMSMEVKLPDDLKKAVRTSNKIAEELRKTSPPGYGLCAPQIGIRLRVIVMQSRGRTRTYINPEIIKRSSQTSQFPEGCYSLPNTIGMGREIRITRPKQITIKYVDEKGYILTAKFNGMTGRAIQHEIDHLNGILIIDHQGGKL